MLIQNSMLLCAAALALVPLLPARAMPAAPAPAPAPTALLGPGPLFQMHRELLAAIDAGDAEKAMAFVDTAGERGVATTWTEPSAFLLDERGLPVSAHKASGVRELIGKQARASRDGGPEWSTKIVDAQADCPSTELACCVLELERSRGVKGGVKHYRSTSLVRVNKEGIKLLHWHVSPADEETARSLADAQK